MQLPSLSKEIEPPDTVGVIKFRRGTLGYVAIGAKPWDARYRHARSHQHWQVGDILKAVEPGFECFLRIDGKDDSFDNFGEAWSQRRRLLAPDEWVAELGNEPVKGKYAAQRMYESLHRTKSEID